MSTPIRELVQIDFKEAIQAVSTSNGYNYTVLHCERERDSPYDGPLPGAFIYDEGDKIQEEHSYAADWIMSLSVELWLKTSKAPNELSTEVNLFKADVEKAVMDDRTRGGYAIETKVTGVGPVWVTTDNLGGIVMTVEINYRTIPGDPYTQG